MKKNILFVIDSLHCAGAEKSLTTLLSLLDYSKYNVDLQLFGYGGALEEVLPEEVNILPPFPYTKFTDLSIKESIVDSIKRMNFDMLSSRIQYSLNLRKDNNSNAQKARIFWQCVSKSIEKSEKIYDIAISYAQGVPTFYVAEKIKAKEKFAWVNVSYRLEDEDRKFQREFYKEYKKIVAVSQSTKEIFIETFKEFEDKMEVIHDINDFNLINKMALVGESYNDNFKGIKILTIGRLAYQKGYDIALDACKELKEKGINFRWYVLGKGPLKHEIERSIKEHGLEENFILLGVTSNPYPYIKNCDIYVQTSKFEGFGIAIAEARMLNKPVVTTRFDAVYTQMIHEKNGLVVDMNGHAVSEGIVRLIEDTKLSNEIVDYLKKDKKGNTDELIKFYNLIKS